MSRKIIQISVTQNYRGQLCQVVALCEDGTLWRKEEGIPWYRIADIPQPEWPPPEVAPNLDDLGCEADF